MDRFTGAPPRQIPEGWQPFILSGDLTYMQDVDTFWGAPSLRMWSNGGTFTAGIWTRVEGVQPGTAYTASIAWGAPNAPETFGRRLGIDPTGGTDPAAPTVAWGPMHYGPGRILNYPPPDVNIDVTAVAQAGVVTVFVYVEHPQSTGDNFIFIDAVSLRPAAVQPTPTPVPPTATPAPRLPTPTPLPTPTATPSPTVPPTATLTGTSPPTATASATPTPVSTDTPTATPTPSAKLRASITPTRRVPPTPSAKLRASPTPDRSGIIITVTVSGPLAIGLSALAGVVTLGFIALRASRRH
jgi:hypothetical protein